MENSINYCTAFLGTQRIASGELGTVALAVKRAIEADPWGSALVFRDSDASRVELDLRGTDADVLERLARTALGSSASNEAGASSEGSDGSASSGPGRPKLGVVAREVTLLPRHWDWLNSQPGGASVALRKLVEEARRAAAGKERIRQAQEATYRFLSAIAGNFPDFEEANRALFAGDRERFDTYTAAWPPDIRDYAQLLATAAFEGGNG